MTNTNVGKIAAINPPPESPEEVYERLAKLSITEYDQVRKKEAKKLGIRVSILDLGVEHARNNSGFTDPLLTMEEVGVVDVVQSNGIVLFHDEDDTAYAEIMVGNHKEIYPVESKQFKKMVGALYYKETGGVVGSQELKDGINTMAGIALFEGDEHKVHLRVAHYKDRYYIDLCNDEWQVVEIDSSGWRVLSESPVKFRRTSSMMPLPMPSHTGDHTKLWDYLNILPEDQKYVLTVILEAFRADTQYVVCELIGEQGSGKSSTQAKIKQLFDPNVLDLRSSPSSVEDIWVGAVNTHSLSYENVSHLSSKAQDALCILATGGGMATRTLYSNLDETVVIVCRPILINGIVPIITASDLSDRSVRIKLPKLDSTLRIESSKLTADFERDKPEIFGGLLDVFAGALSQIDNVQLNEKPRMVSFAILGEAIDLHLGMNWNFTKEYMSMRDSLLVETAQNNSGAMAVVSMMKKTSSTFNGTYKELLNILNENHKPKHKVDDWPTSPRKLSAILARYAPGLESMGVKVTRGHHAAVGNMVTLTLV